VPPKYRDPVTGKTWTGRGKPPNWMPKENREQFLI
jgi:DNA-binding protein H-NS